METPQQVRWIRSALGLRRIRARNERFYTDNRLCVGSKLRPSQRRQNMACPCRRVDAGDENMLAVLNREKCYKEWEAPRDGGYGFTGHQIVGSGLKRMTRLSQEKSPQACTRAGRHPGQRMPVELFPFPAPRFPIRPLEAPVSSGS